MAVKVRPLHDRLIVERIEDTEQMVGGIIIPDTAKEKPQQGKVLAVGKGKMRDDGTVTPLDVKAGDMVLFGKYSGRRSRWMARSISSCARMRFWASSKAARRRSRSPATHARAGAEPPVGRARN